MRLLDANIFIYAAKPQYRQLLVPLIADPDSRASDVTRLEALGFHLISQQEKAFLENSFANLPVLQVTSAIIDKAIELRQQRKMSAGDAIHAATALLNNLEFYTRNAADFKWIAGLKVVNPMP